MYNRDMKMPCIGEMTWQIYMICNHVMKERFIVSIASDQVNEILASLIKQNHMNYKTHLI